MEEFPKEKKKKYTYENPCPLCEFPVKVREHNPDFCENARESEEEKETESLKKRGDAEQEYLIRQMMGLEDDTDVVEPQEIKKEKGKQQEETQEKKETDRLERINSAIESLNEKFKFEFEKWLYVIEQEKDLPDFKENLGKIFDEVITENKIFESKDKIEVLKKIEVDISFAQIQIIFEDFKEEKLKQLKR
ncbi:MAG: hypothetical protein HY773_02340 [Candidatus Terrybacteria bacterium]|nr:hypothetical protein [Candidatus Terrybacteria bacterium]